MSIFGFRALIFFQFIALLVSLYIDVLFSSDVLNELEIYAHDNAAALSAFHTKIFIGYEFLIPLVFITSTLGLLFLKNWARFGYLSIAFMLIPFHFVEGISVTSPSSEIFIEFSNYCYGAIIAIIFISPFKNEFKKAL